MGRLRESPSSLRSSLGTIDSGDAVVAARNWSRRRRSRWFSRIVPTQAFGTSVVEHFGRLVIDLEPADDSRTRSTVVSAR